MPNLSTVVLSIKGDVKKANLQIENNTLTIETIQKYFKKKDEPEEICCYEHDNKFIYIFGYKKGKKGTENKVELPSPHNTIVLFGDALVIVSLHKKWSSPIPFTTDLWDKFYNSYNEYEKESDEEGEDDEEDVISEAGTEKSVKDDFDNDEEVELDTVIEEEEELEVAPVKKKRGVVYNCKVDPNALKENVKKTDAPDTNKIRMLCMKGFEFLKDTFTDDDISKLEQNIFEVTIDNAHKNYILCNWKSQQFCELYRQIVRSILSNIHPESPVKNPRLLTRILEGEFSLYSIPFMTSYDMYPEKWFALKDKLLQREQKILEGNKSRATDQFKCRRCNKRECTFYELQTRSADEPMTIFITCLNCGKEWRQGG
jgi:DNA-directed RNA polymerase subunit M/transcription elongation factor TFIIS